MCLSSCEPGCALHVLRDIPSRHLCVWAPMWIGNLVVGRLDLHPGKVLQTTNTEKTIQNLSCTCAVRDPGSLTRIQVSCLLLVSRSLRR